MSINCFPYFSNANTAVDCASREIMTRLFRKQSLFELTRQHHAHGNHQWRQLVALALSTGRTEVR
jgi:hypothetical protein